MLKGVLFGEPLLGEQRMEFNYLVDNKLILDKTPIHVRLMTLKYINMKLTNNIQDIITLRNYLLDESEKLSYKKSRYYKNSKQHRLKLRIVQTLAIITHQETEWNDRFLNIILHENNQPDIVCIIQIIIAVRLKSDAFLINLLKTANEYSNSAMISLFIISFLYCKLKITTDVKENPEFASELIKLILPWTLGQNFNVRFYAQITIYHLIQQFDIEKKYEFLLNSIYASLKHGNSEQNLHKLNDIRFHMNCNDYLKHYVIFTLIPKLTNLALDEWYINFEQFMNNCSDDASAYSPLNCQITDKLLQKFYDDANCNEIQIIEEEETYEIENLQRKINPFDINDYKNDDFKYENADFEQKQNDMIVIASLVCKLPNLGGIARTCEVFGIKKLCLNSIKYTEAKEFKGLSLTAEKWLNIKELKCHDIQEYLLKKKSQGYKIVGAEQTASSINFVNFQFPYKSILLLGHEKEGIPANLIAYVDYVVEIPQSGNIRSLNVHVTAALFLWEYCKQNFNNDQK